MVNQIIIFHGAKKDFEEMLNERIEDVDKCMPFMELIQHYNARLRPNESGVKESALSRRIEVGDCVVKAEDYGSILEHVLSNFVNIVTLNHDIEKLYIHNPPKRVLASLRSVYDEEIEYLCSDYQVLNRSVLIEVNKKLQEGILGQEECKKQLISGLYKLISNASDRPAVLMLYGPSGVGKTETAKIISEVLGGNMLRVQFSMMQSNEAYNYVFGSEHSRSSFARDLLSRETNIVLIDEFDKVNPVFYNAFYELFDEGHYVDANYSVALNNTIFICTSNFKTENEIRSTLNPAMYSRLGYCIEYTDISKGHKCLIVEKWYLKIIESLEEDEKNVIVSTDILKWFKENTNRYDNIRILKTKLENAIYEKLADEFVLQLK